MKKIAILICIFWLLSIPANAQASSKKQHKISPGLALSAFGKYDILTLLHPDNAPEYSSHAFYSCGINGFIKTGKRVELETGMNVCRHLINIDPAFPDPPYYDKTERIDLIGIPLNIRVEWKYFFISSGIMGEIEIHNTNIIRNQSGLGMNASLGLNYKFKNGISIYTGPIIFMHSILPAGDGKLAGISLLLGVRLH
jgi:hypothetical protein